MYQNIGLQSETENEKLTITIQQHKDNNITVLLKV